MNDVTDAVHVRTVNHPLYAITHSKSGHDLAVHVVSRNATHSDGSLGYDVHNLWGWQILGRCGGEAIADFFVGHRETKATYKPLYKVFLGKRPFIVSCFTASATGSWDGDGVRHSRSYFSITFIDWKDHRWR